MSFVSVRLSMFPEAKRWETMRFEGKQNSLFPAGHKRSFSELLFRLKEFENTDFAFSCTISDIKYAIPCLTTFANTENRVENTTCSRVFLDKL